DVGQDSYEEINRIELGGNYGWPCKEGPQVTAAMNVAWKCPQKNGFIEPTVAHAHVAGGRAVISGYPYRGAAIAGLQGTFLYGDFMQKELRSLTLEDGAWTSRLLNEGGPRDGYVSFAEDVSGEIYSVALFDRKIHKVVQSAAPAPVAFPQKLSETGC